MILIYIIEWLHMHNCLLYILGVQEHETYTLLLPTSGQPRTHFMGQLRTFCSEAENPASKISTQNVKVAIIPLNFMVHLRSFGA
jgi:hypothetical protein